jgi:hypothetical protein
MSYRFNYDYYVLSCYSFGFKRNGCIICFLALQMFRRPRTKHISLCIILHINSLENVHVIEMSLNEKFRKNKICSDIFFLKWVYHLIYAGTHKSPMMWGDGFILDIRMSYRFNYDYYDYRQTTV